MNAFDLFGDMLRGTGETCADSPLFAHPGSRMVSGFSPNSPASASENSPYTIVPDGAAPLALRWRVVYPNGSLLEMDAPSGLDEAEARELAERHGGPVASLEPVAVEARQGRPAEPDRRQPRPEPEPEPVTCRDCRHWTPDPINPPHGLGRCGVQFWRLPWPGATCSIGIAR
jgi:hypothetical protein